MPVRIVGMIGVTPPRSDAALHVIEGGLSPSYLTQFARAHDDAGFDLALVGCTSSSAEGFLVALHAAAHAKQLGYLVAHRPGFVAPTLMARKIATFDHLTNGRLAVHIITGKTDDEQQGDGDFSPKTERYRRAAEYLELMKLAWSNERPFDFSGEFYRVRAPLPMYARSRSRTRCCSSAPPRMARSRWVRDSATSTPSTPSRWRRTHRQLPDPSSDLRADAGLHRFAAPDHCGARRRRLGEGQPDSGSDDRQERVEPPGGGHGTGR